MNAPPMQKHRPPGEGSGANECLQLGGSGQLQNYRKAPSRATLKLVEIRDEAGRFQGLEAVSYG